MRKILYVEPEMEIHRFGSKSDVRTIDGDLDVSESPGEEGGGDFGWGEPY